MARRRRSEAALRARMRVLNATLERAEAEYERTLAAYRGAARQVQRLRTMRTVTRKQLMSALGMPAAPAAGGQSLAATGDPR